MDPDDLITLRVQYLVDSDPFNSFAMYPIPSRAPAFSFASSAPLATQLGGLLRHLGAPQRVRCILVSFGGGYIYLVA
ncbi:AAEL014857-PA [Aedes aegypti]|uniref:AAEL014857-PA n=1 Tax=Aedes aegypti TaxID=7159 RepID=Q16F92_AEDAE|nr:AAEL014857-PA [Aedes aegypti]